MTDPCSLCGGTLCLLGQLGDLLHYFCQDCGMQFSTPNDSGS